MRDIIITIIFEFVFGYILQGLTFVIGMFAFNRCKIEPLRYFGAATVFIVVSYLLRLLPISFGIHTLLDLLALFLMGIFVLKFPTYRTFLSTLIITVILLVTELLNVFALIGIFGQDKFSEMMSVPTSKAMVGFPAAALFAAVVFTLYFILTKNSGKDESADGKISA